MKPPRVSLAVPTAPTLAARPGKARTVLDVNRTGAPVDVRIDQRTPEQKRSDDMQWEARRHSDLDRLLSDRMASDALFQAPLKRGRSGPPTAGAALSDIDRFESLLARSDAEDLEDENGTPAKSEDAEHTPLFSPPGAPVPHSRGSSVGQQESPGQSRRGTQSHPRIASQSVSASEVSTDAQTAIGASASFTVKADTEKRPFELIVQTRDFGPLHLRAEPQAGGWHVRLRVENPVHMTWLRPRCTAIARGLSRDLQSDVSVELDE